MSDRSEWAVRARKEMPSGTYYQLNVRSGGRESAGTVTVKARAKPGPPYVCLTCLLNDCEHTRFVALHDTPDSDAGESNVPRNYPRSAVTESVHRSAPSVGGVSLARPSNRVGGLRDPYQTEG